jgi:hypothetical protein
VLKTTALTEKFDFAAFREQHGEETIPLLLLSSGKVTPLTVLDPKAPSEGKVLVHLAPPSSATPPAGGSGSGSGAGSPPKKS